MKWLHGVWTASLLLSALALLIMILLIIVRATIARRERIRQAERSRLVPLLLAMHGDGIAEDGQLAPDLLTDLSTELVQMVRGSDKEKLIANAYRHGVADRLRTRMASRSPRTRLAAAEALAEFGDEQSMERLREALHDSNADVRLTAAAALASAGEAPHVRVLIQKLSLGAREHSKLIVGLFRDIAAKHPEEIRELIRDGTTRAPVRMAAVEALSGSGDYSLVPLIAELTMKANPEGTELPRYLHALGKLGHPAAAHAVDFGLSCGAWEARAAAAEAAGRIGLAESAERLKELLDDPKWSVRFRAGEALLALRKKGLLLLRETAKNGSELASRAARLTLAERGIAP